MYISAPTLDDLLRKVYSKLLLVSLKGPGRITATKGANVELSGVLLQLTNPRARLSRTERRGILFSCLGELLWYLSGTNDLDFIRYYIEDYKKHSDDGKTIHGGYGPRMLSPDDDNQIIRIVNILSKKPSSRQAVIQLFDEDDLKKKYKDVPCTCTMQFMIRGNRLNMITHMRSNDAYMGLVHDIFTFTMIQEIIARTLKVELGTYKHSVGSLHLYDDNREYAQHFINEGWQENVDMPAMPQGDPWSSIRVLLDAEADIRMDRTLRAPTNSLATYWKDIFLILKIYRNSKELNGASSIRALKKKISSEIYLTYVKKRERRQLLLQKIKTQPEQLPLL